jgi:hypothetical protein
MEASVQLHALADLPSGKESAIRSRNDIQEGIMSSFNLGKAEKDISLVKQGFDERMTLKWMLDKKFWEELIAYFPLI